MGDAAAGRRRLVLLDLAASTTVEARSWTGTFWEMMNRLVAEAKRAMFLGLEVEREQQYLLERTAEGDDQSESSSHCEVLRGKW